MEKSIHSLIKELEKTNDFAPVYVLAGEESYFLDKVLELLEQKVVTEEEKAFNYNVFYGLESTYEKVVSIARSYPMMAAKRMVVLREAQLFKELDKLESYIKQPVPSTVLVVVHKTKPIDGRKKILKTIKESKTAVFAPSNPPSENQLIDFIASYAATKNLKIHPKAAFALKELLGNNLQRMAAELDKMAISLPAGAEVELQQVADQVGFSRDYNVFTAPGIIAMGNKTAAYRMASQMAKNPNQYPLPLMISGFYTFFSKLLAIHGVNMENTIRAKNGETPLDAYREVKVFDRKEMDAARSRFNLKKTIEVMNILHSYDLKSKGMNNEANTPPAELMREMFLKLLNC